LEEILNKNFDKILSDFFAIINRGKKNNTYKFVLARAILEFVKNNEKEIKKNIDSNINTSITYSALADHFLEFYWYQQKSKIPQNYNTTSPPNAVVEMKNLFEKYPQPENFRMAKKIIPEVIADYKEKILEKVFGKGDLSQVIPKFQKVSGSSTDTVFYDDEFDNKKIIVNPNVMQFFIHYRMLLEPFVVLELAKFLDNIKSSPGIVSKIEAPKFDRTTLEPQKRVLNKYFKNCFYCNENLDGVKIHVDHFIPFSYIFENKYWNLVLSCSACNLHKSDSLAKDFQMELIKRNNDFRDKIDDLRKDLKKLDMYDWEKEFDRIYRNCRQYGFSEIDMSVYCKEKTK
jgi:hypothetical protein